MAITPYLYYEDVDRAVQFLTQAFGFRKYGVQMRGPDGKINHAAMKLGGGTIMMGRPPKGYSNPKRLGQATQSLYINIRAIDKHFERATKAGVAVLEEPTNTEYGHRRYGATDPEGHEWYFAQAIVRRKPKRKTTRRAESKRNGEHRCIEATPNAPRVCEPLPRPRTRPTAVREIA